MLSFPYHPVVVGKAKREGTWPGWARERDCSSLASLLGQKLGGRSVCLEKHRPCGSGNGVQEQGTLQAGCNTHFGN